MEKWIQLDWVQKIYNRAAAFCDIKKLISRSKYLEKRVTEYNRNIAWLQKQQSSGRWKYNLV